MEPNVITSVTNSGAATKDIVKWINDNSAHLYAAAGAILGAALVIVGICCAKDKKVGCFKPNKEVSNSKNETLYSTIEAARRKTANATDVELGLVSQSKETESVDKEDRKQQSNPDTLTSNAHSSSNTTSKAKAALR